MTIFFDLDGTLIDSRERLYCLFQKLVPESDFSIEEYWELKRNKVNHLKILTEKFNYTEEAFGTFETEWLAQIESQEMLDLDVKVNGIEKYLKKLSAKYNLYVVTARQSPSKAKKQLEKLGLAKYFKDILVTEQKYTKVELIKKYCNVCEQAFLIGDTGKDILTGKELGIKTIALTSGFMNKENLLQYNPDFLYDKVVNIDFL